MKKVVALLISLAITPLTASINCLSDMKNQSKVEWYSVACNCPCNKVKGNHCVECGHLQNPRPYILIDPSQKSKQQNLPLNSEKGFDSLARAYVKKHRT